MDDLIQDELTQVLKAWQSGGSIRTIALGHPVRKVGDVEQRHKFRQLTAYAYCFLLIETCLEERPDSWEMFCVIAAAHAPRDISLEEREAAESLAWKALVRGWNRATAGFPEEHEIRIRQRPGDEA
jgi:hypothetical protein